MKKRDSHYARCEASRPDRLAEVCRNPRVGVDGSLEEIQRETYQGHDAWSITLGVPRNLEQLPPFSRLSANPVQYKIFLIDAETGEMLAMKLHALAPR